MCASIRSLTGRQTSGQTEGAKAAVNHAALYDGVTAFTAAVQDRVRTGSVH